MLIFFFNDTATTEIYTLSLHDALPIYLPAQHSGTGLARPDRRRCNHRVVGSPERVQLGSRIVVGAPQAQRRSEEHTSELQSRQYLVCRLLLEKKNTTDSNAA